MPKFQQTMQSKAATLAIAAALGPGSAMADTWEIVLPSHMPRSDELKAEIWDFFLNDLGPGNDLTLYDGLRLRERLRISVPDDPSFEDPRTKTKALGRETAQLGREIDSLAEEGNPEEPYRISFPQFVYEYSQTRSSAEAEMLVVTTGLHVSELEPSFSFRLHDGTLYLPTDGHIEAPLSESPFGTQGLEQALEGVGVHFCVLSDETRLTTYQKDELRRFWSLYIEWLGGEIATFTSNLPACFDRWRDKARDGLPKEKLDISEEVLAMRNVVRDPLEEETRAASGRLPDGVTEFTLFSSSPHPTLVGVDVTTGITYRSEEYPLSYKTAWCYAMVQNKGAAIRVVIGAKTPLYEIEWSSTPKGTLDAAGIGLEHVVAGRSACRFPPDDA